jgi:trans-aconitate 2-methyltransferase
MTRDWDASTYDRVSEPQVEWARQVLGRLDLRGDETVLDAGCGSGRVTLMLLELLPAGRVIAVDAAPSMVEQARAALPEDRAEVLPATDLTELELAEPVDVVFSNAVFHWVQDHDALFERLHAALRPGGRLVAQCGGEGNVQTFLRAATEVASRPPFAEHLRGWTGPWRFEAPEPTEERLRRAGFDEVRCWLSPGAVVPPEPLAYLRAVCLGHHLLELPEELRDDYVAAVAERCGDPLELDYVRLNIDARRDEP